MDNVENLIRDRLEHLGSQGEPFAIFDPALIDDAGQAEVRDLARVLSPEKFVVLAVPAAVLPALLPSLAHDHSQAFMQGRPLVIHPIGLEIRDENPSHRPVDTDRLKTAKTALAVHTFRIVSAQTALELARSVQQDRAAAVEAGKCARERVEDAVWRGGADPDGAGKMRRFDGLIDRGRLLAPTFFGVDKAGEVARAEEHRIAGRIEAFDPDAPGAEDITAMLEQDNFDRLRHLADHELRAKAHEGAMARWSASVREGKPIEGADGLDVANGIVRRQSAPDLMRVAIDGDLNPAEVHRNLETMREAFEVGRLIGRLSRGCSIELAVGQAKILILSLHIFASQLHETGKPETEADGCAWFLADAALACHDLGFWNATVARILDTGEAETVAPQAP